MGNSLGDFVARLRGSAAVRTLGGLSDHELLGRFVATNDGAAFAVLVERHGPMVLGVCRRLLPRHDAEDACQAAFLVLARKASSLRKGSLGCWLHGVARRVAANARRDAELRKGREAGAESRRQRCPAEEATWNEVRAALDEELGRLPKRYRDPLVLCYLGCLTRDEAASRLGVSPGALHGCLERGREMLRARLSKRGLSLSSALAVASLGETALPPMLAVSTANAATLFAAGQPLSVGANVLALTREVLMRMTLSKVKLGAAVLGVALAVGSFLPFVSAQEKRPDTGSYITQVQQGVTFTEVKQETDEAFIRRMSKDLREAEPTATEVHFFVSSKEANKRQKLIDLFIAERKAKKAATAFAPWANLLVEDAVRPRVKPDERLAQVKPDEKLSEVKPDERWRPQAKLYEEWLGLIIRRAPTAELVTLQKSFFKDVQAANGKAEVAKAIQAYLDGLLNHLKTNPSSPEAAEVIRQVVLLYEAQGKKVEAEAWRDRLKRASEPRKPGATGEGGSMRPGNMN